MRGISITGTPRFDSTQYLSVSSNKTVFAARVNQSAFTASFAQVAFDGVTTGDYLDIEVGMTVLFSASDNKRTAYHTGRVRKAPTSSILYIDETSATIADNDYIFVLNDFRIAQKLARYTAGVQYKDYDLTFAQPSPVITGLQSAYAGFASGSPEGYTVAFSASAYAVTDGATISTTQWTFPSGATVTAGDPSTPNVTVRFDSSPDEYWVKYVVTDSGARTLTRWIPVWSHNDTYPPATGFTGANISGDLDSGFNATVDAFDGVSALLDSTLTCVWSVDRYNDTETTINGNVNFVGRFRRDTSGAGGDVDYSTLPRDASFEIEGAGSQLARLTAPLLALINDTSPTVWDEIDTLTLWRAVVHVLQTGSTFLSLHSLSFDSTADTFQVEALETQEGGLLGAINDIYDSINGAIEFAPSGEARCVRNANYLSSDARNALTTIANFAESDAIGVSYEHEHVDLVGRIESSGGTFNSNSNEVTPFLSVAPGVAQGAGDGTSQLHRQVLTRNVTAAVGQSELNQRSGNHYAYVNRRDQISMEIPDGYYFLVPSRYVWYTWTLSTYTSNRGWNYTTSTRWQLVSISFVHDNETGSRTVNAVFEIETAGAPGQTVPYPPPSSISPTIPPLPAFNTYPILPDLPIALPSLNPIDLPAFVGSTTPEPEVPTDGNTVVIIPQSGESIWITTNFLVTSAPTWVEITPTLDDDESVKSFAWSGFGIDGYLLTYDSANTRSRLWYASSVIDANWSAGGWVDGIGTDIRTTGTTGEVYIRLAQIGAWTETFDFTTGKHGWDSYDSGQGTTPFGATYSIGVGWKPIESSATGLNNRAAAIGILINPETTLTSIEVEFDLTKGTYDIPSENLVSIAEDPPFNLLQGFSASGFSSGSGITREWTGTLTTDNYVTLTVRPSRTAGATNGDCTILRATLNGEGSNPFSSNSVISRFSDDYGETYGSAQSIGAVSAAGLATIPLRSEALAGKSGQIELSDDDGETYTAYGDPIPDAGVIGTCIVIPRRTINSSTVTNSSLLPDYILASSTLDTATSEISIYAVDDDGTDFTDITPNNGGDYGTAVSVNCVAMSWNTGRKIAIIFDFDGTRRLYVSTGSGIGFWDDVAALSADADCIRFRRGDANARQLYFCDGVPKYSPNFGATILSKLSPNDPTTDPLILIEPYG